MKNEHNITVYWVTNGRHYIRRRDPLTNSERTERLKKSDIHFLPKQIYTNPQKKPQKRYKLSKKEKHTYKKTNNQDKFCFGDFGFDKDKEIFDYDLYSVRKCCSKTVMNMRIFLQKHDQNYSSDWSDKKIFTQIQKFLHPDRLTGRSSKEMSQIANTYKENCTGQTMVHW